MTFWTPTRKHGDAARLKAIQAAKEKAEALAQALGSKISNLRTISEGYGSYWSGSGYGWGWAGGYYANSRNEQSAESGGETLPLGQIGVRATVSVTFDLET